MTNPLKAAVLADLNNNFSLPNSTPLLEVVGDDLSPNDSDESFQELPSPSTNTTASPAILSPDAQISLDLAEIKHQGWLKMQKKYKRWKSQWCVIRGRKLAVYRDENVNTLLI